MILELVRLLIGLFIIAVIALVGVSAYTLVTRVVDVQTAILEENHEGPQPEASERGATVTQN